MANPLKRTTETYCVSTANVNRKRGHFYTHRHPLPIQHSSNTCPLPATLNLHPQRVSLTSSISHHMLEAHFQAGTKGLPVEGLQLRHRLSPRRRRRRTGAFLPPLAAAALPPGPAPCPIPLAPARLVAEEVEGVHQLPRIVRRGQEVSHHSSEHTQQCAASIRRGAG